MKKYVVLLRGINVGGKNKILMAVLKTCLEEAGFAHVVTYIASGNIILESDLPQKEIATKIEQLLPDTFTLDDAQIRALVLSEAELRAVVHDKPKGFGEQPEKYHSDAIFLIGITAEEALPVFKPREGVDAIWPGAGVIYSQRLSAERTKSRLSSIAGTPAYKVMTIRSWNTTTKLLALLDAA